MHSTSSQHPRLAIGTEADRAGYGGSIACVNGIELALCDVGHKHGALYHVGKAPSALERTVDIAHDLASLADNTAVD